jgi:ribonuclease E
MVKRMLIDSTHPEETRVVVVNGTRLEELDVETSAKKQLKGNIYLAKIVRVEPSLQAAFVDYGGNRHGFLAFSEIHPDYFQIPVADRQALLAAQNAEHFRETAESIDAPEPSENDAGEAAPAESADPSDVAAEGDSAPLAEGEDAVASETGAEAAPARQSVEVVGGDEASEQEIERRRARILRNYKIQEVIKRRQIILVQVVKEERGNKGAALTTYLSLAGRYCVLMPNTARGGGVSRKIINPADRKRLKAIAQEMDIPEGMALIVRTAGSERSKAEIKRDYEYLLRMWDNVRDLTLKSAAPALTYEEASLIKRSIRDLYSRDIDEVIVDGEEGYRQAKDYMRMLTPSHAKKVQPYRDPVMPMFHRYQVETQLDAMHSPVVQLRSGGYIVINQTEALVAIDVNSGRATKERHIEETAAKTNLEAADEVARQLRLRDLAGLIVIDFIDMEESRNNHAVERRLKEALKNDRARIQVGRISAFGLLELSRQRLRPSLQETTFSPCPHCAGTGMIRSVESAAVHVLRAIEEEGIRYRSSEITVTAANVIALYILNQKREALSSIEERYQFRVFLTGDDSLIPPAYRMDRVKSERGEEMRPIPVALPAPEELDEPDEAEDEPETQDEVEGTAQTEETEGGTEARSGDEEQPQDANRKRRRRRRRKRRGDQPDSADGAEGEEGEKEDGEEVEDGEAGSEGEEGPAEEGEEGEDDGEGRGEEAGEGDTDTTSGDDRQRKRRRGRRGGRRRRRPEDEAAEAAQEDQPQPQQQVVSAPVIMQQVRLTQDIVADVFEAAEAAEEAAMEARRASAAEPKVEPTPVTVAIAETPEIDVAPEAAPVVEEKPKRKRAPRKKAEDVAAVAETEPAAESGEGEDKPKRKRAPRKKAVVEEAPVDAVPVEVVAETVAPQPPAEVTPVTVEPVAETTDESEPPNPASPPRRGWWNRLLS